MNRTTRRNPLDASSGAMGAFACGLAAAILSLLWGATGFGMNHVQESTDGLVIGLVLHFIVGGGIGTIVGFLYAIPVYLLLQRLDCCRLSVLLVLGALGGAFVGSAIAGFDPGAWPIALGLGVCGVLCSGVFWFSVGTDAPP